MSQLGHAKGPATGASELAAARDPLLRQRGATASKRRLYRWFGVPHYWIVDPESRTIEAYALGEREYARAG